MDTQRINELHKLQEKLNIMFNKLTLLNTAFQHSSYVNEHPGDLDDNEKLELLGDSVLAFVVNEHLYKSFPDSNEGELSRIKSIVVSEHSLAIIAKELDIGQYLLLGRGEQLSNGMNRKAILADTLEALLGAYCLDSGMEAVKKFILPLVIEEIKKVEKNEHQKDYKTQLQLIIQQQEKICPTYETIAEEGPDHNKLFHVQVVINEQVAGTGSGSSKKLAQQDAARDALIKLGYEMA